MEEIISPTRMSKEASDTITAFKLISLVTITYTKYVKSLQIDISLCKETLLSGWMCVVFMLSLPIICNIKIEETHWYGILKRTYAYVCSYLLLDHYIDCPEVSKQDKIALLRLIQKDDGELCDESSSSSKAVEVYKKLLTLKKDLVATTEDANYLARLLKSIVKSYTAQNKTEKTLKQYLKTCKSKGGMTVLCGVRLIYKKAMDSMTDRDLIGLGYCIQLFDDIIDCSSDIRSGISTACTSLVTRRKKLDNMFFVLVYKTFTLSNTFAVYGFVIRQALYYSSERSKHYSLRFRKALSLYPKKYVSKEEKFQETMETFLQDVYKD